MAWAMPFPENPVTTFHGGEIVLADFKFLLNPLAPSQQPLDCFSCVSISGHGYAIAPDFLCNLSNQPHLCFLVGRGYKVPFHRRSKTALRAQG